MNDTDKRIADIKRHILVGMLKADVEKYLESNGFDYQVFTKGESLVSIGDSLDDFESVIIIKIALPNANRVVQSNELIIVGFYENQVVEVASKRRHTGP